MRKGYFFAQDAIVDNHTFKFAAVTDLDQLSRDKESSKPLFRSILLSGTVARTPESNQYTITFDDPYRVLRTKHNEAGRGAEFSELVIYQNRLLTFDDRTGDVFEIVNKPGGKDSFVVPRLVFTEGDGETDKGMKWEWSTIKNNELYLGSMGKEYTNPDGSIANTNNLWITIMNHHGEARRVDWKNNYDVVRHALNADPPGYVIHEAVNWSPILNKWVFLPRRVSDKAYDENQDEKQGATKIVLVDDKFTTPTVVDIKFKDNDPLHGFSTFAFVPNSGDRHALAIRSVEENCVGAEEKCEQRSYFTVLDVLTGDVLCDEVQYPENLKFEGVEFVKLDTAPPL
jgi:soluble calcium-activated nucleotidase 1